MRRKLDPETKEQKHERFEREAHRRSEYTAAEDRDIDDRVRQSIKQYGP